MGSCYGTANYGGIAGNSKFNQINKRNIFPCVFAASRSAILKDLRAVRPVGCPDQPEMTAGCLGILSLLVEIGCPLRHD
jgi:hypothetical protein